MTDKEFDEFMEREGWSPERRRTWHDVTPIADAEGFKLSLSICDGAIEVRPRGIVAE